MHVNSLCVRACGARIASRTDELREEDVGTGAGLFEVKLIGDEYFTFVTECKDPKACTILLRGASKEILAVRTFHTASFFTYTHHHRVERHSGSLCQGEAFSVSLV